MIRCLAPALLLLAACGESAPPKANSNKAAAAAPAPAPVPDTARVRLETDAGAIVVELDGRRAPVTTGNFLAYVDQGRFDDTRFYRAARTRGAPGRGYIQGGINRVPTRMLPPIAHEPTSETGLRHVAGTISMARRAPGTAMGEFFIMVNAIPAMDAHGSEPGFAAFGRVVEGMDVVRRILASPTHPTAGAGAMRGQMILAPVRIVRARRVPG